MHTSSQLNHEASNSQKKLPPISSVANIKAIRDQHQLATHGVRVPIQTKSMVIGDKSPLPIPICSSFADDSEDLLMSLPNQSVAYSINKREQLVLADSLAHKIVQKAN